MKNFLLLVCMLVYTFGNTQSLTKLWETPQDLDTPESVLCDAKNNKLYIANIGGKEPWKADGNGFISILDLDGKTLYAKWITGLDAPKGMARVKNILYVADITNVKVINIKSGKITKTIEIEGSKTLNDVAADTFGNVYVSDSRGRRVYKIANDKYEVLIDTIDLKGPNGLFLDKGKLQVLDNSTLHAYENGKLTPILDGLTGGNDGIERISIRDMIVSCWSGTIYSIDYEKKTKKLLLDTTADKINAADIGINFKEKIIYVPTFFNNTVAAYKYNR